MISLDFIILDVITTAQRTHVSSLLHTSVCSHSLLHRPAEKPRRASFKALKEFSFCQPGLKTYSVKATFFLDTFCSSQMNLQVVGATPSGPTWMSAAHHVHGMYSTFCPGFPKRLLCRRNNVGSFLDFAPEVTQSASSSQVLAGD